jgi:DNA primase large subunit
MQLSAHYSPYTSPVILTVVGNTCARFFYASDRAIEEIKKIEWTGSDTDRADFFELTASTLQKLVKKTPATLHLCAIEIEKAQVAEALEKKTGQKVERIIAKNLSSLPLDAILRILHEQHGV